MFAWIVLTAILIVASNVGFSRAYKRLETRLNSEHQG